MNRPNTDLLLALQQATLPLGAVEDAEAPLHKHSRPRFLHANPRCVHSRIPHSCPRLPPQRKPQTMN